MNEEEHLDRYRELISEVLAQAVEDFVGLRARGAIRDDFTVDDYKWIKRLDGSVGRPLNIDSATDAMELVWFFQRQSLDRLCAFVGIPACRIRIKLGFAPEAVVEKDAARVSAPNLKISNRYFQRHETTNSRLA